MSEFENLEDAKSFFERDTFAKGCGIVIDEIFDGGCVCSMDITDGHKNAEGGVMGGATFTLADFAFAVAANNAHKTTVVQNVAINFFSQTHGKRLIARAECKKDGRTTCVYNVDITDDLGKSIAQFVGTGYKL